MDKSKHTLEDFKVNVRIKLSALWTSVMFCYIYGDYFELYVPKKVEGLLNGNNLLDSQIKLFGATIMLTIPALMIFLSLILRPKVSRLLNITFGVIYSALMLMIAIASIASNNRWLFFYAFLAFLEIILTLIIVRHAWTWQKKQTDTKFT
jgi:hypothetical protein